MAEFVKNGTFKISVALLGTFLTGCVASYGVVYMIRSSETSRIELEASRRATILFQVSLNRHELAMIRARQDWVIEALRAFAKKDDVDLSPVPSSPPFEFGSIQP